MEPREHLIHLEIFYSSEDATEWANYFKESIIADLEFKTQLQVNIQLNCIHQNLNNFSQNSIFLVLISPEFINFVCSAAGISFPFINHNRVVAIFLGTEDDERLDNLRPCLLHFDKWIKAIASEDGGKMKQTFAKIFKIINQSVIDDLPKEGQSLPEAQFELIPNEITERNEKITVLLNRPLNSNDNLIISMIDPNTDKDKVLSYTMYNPYTLQFIVPEMYGASRTLTVHITNKDYSLGIHFLKFYSLLNKINDYLKEAAEPIKFLCQALQVNNLEECDNVLAQTFNESKLPNYKLFDRKKGLESRVDEELPTLLHFAVEHGLRELCSKLLECPGAVEACEVENSFERTPINIAEHKGFLDIAEMLQNFHELSLFQESTLYNMWKETKSLPVQMPTRSSDAQTYESMDPYENMPDGDINRNSGYINASIKSDLTDSKDGYFSMTLSHPDTGETYSHLDLPEAKHVQTRRVSEPCIKNSTSLSKKPSWGSADKIFRSNIMDVDLMSEYSIKNSSLCKKSSWGSADREYRPNIMDVSLDLNTQVPAPSPVLSQTSSQQELIELLQLFKTEEYTMNEVELLFRSWQQRNSGNTGKTFKQKQEELKKMREHYELLKNNLKKDNKNASLLDRFFLLLKKKPKKEPKLNRVTTATTGNLPKCFRVLGLDNPDDLTADGLLKNNPDSLNISSLIHVIPSPESVIKSKRKRESQTSISSTSSSSSSERTSTISWNSIAEEDISENLSEVKLNENRVSAPPIPPRNSTKHKMIRPPAPPPKPTKLTIKKTEPIYEFS